ncbi:ABC transporter ATP-binding protein [Candidatus Bathyarchaeota archaeon]|nr:ABC transporter ATP-binding protein [Candidatus Bathyarchaeota archaeon]
MTETVLSVKELRTWFPVRRFFGKSLYVKAVDGVSLNIDAGEALAIVGESGSGKTTLGKTCLMLVRPYSGRIIYRGKDITDLNSNDLLWYRKEAQIIYQDPFSSLSPFFTIRRILEEPLIIHKIASADERLAMIERAMEDVRLTPIEEFSDKYPHMLSGGQRQRVAIARALIMKPKFVVADEPVSMLDASVRVEILYLLRQLQEKYGISFMYITHDVATVKYFSERIAIMYGGKVVEQGPIREVIKEPLHPYTQALIDAIPDPDPKNRFNIRKVPAGEAPDPINPPTGCRYNPRCPWVKDRCIKEGPKLFEVEAKREVACFLYT